ncbi:MAG: hypothetical protein FJW37_04570 [Acidobacteria bacterium]|nr:hypothetical protein [Acidobacteriota bacterium]
MKFPVIFFFFAASALCFQGAPAPAGDLSPETVVAEIDGRKITVGELRNFMSMLPPQLQQSALRDRKAILQNYALVLRLSALAEEAKLDQQSPYREMLLASRRNMLANAQIGDMMNRFSITPEEERKRYELSRDRYTQVKVKVIYIPFLANPEAHAAAQGKKSLDEAAAKAKALKLAAEARAGADFVELVRKHSEDEASLKKDGDFGVIRRSDSVPDAIRTAVFQLKSGEITDPVRQPNGFYVFRCEEISLRPIEEVRGEVAEEARQAKLREWIEGITRSLSVKFENEAFFASPSSPVAPPGGPRRQP